MEDSRLSSSLRDKEERYRRGRSASHDSSEEERRRRRRRKERERAERDRNRDRDRDRDRRREDDRRDKYDEREQKKRRRSRSPGDDESSRRKRPEGTNSKHTGGTRDRSPSRRDRGEKDSRAHREDPASEVSRRSRAPLPSQEASFQSKDGGASSGAVVLAEEVEKQKPNFGNTGLLAAASNSVAQADGSSITLKYHEPAEARKPSAKDVWKLFVFKGEDILETIELSARSCWLVGKDLAVVDLPAEHPTISKQHAVIQFRYVERKNEFGDRLGRVRPYLIDLESTNGTLLNKEGIPASRYLEVRDKDMIQFGHSTREYVLMLSPK